MAPESPVAGGESELDLLFELYRPARASLWRAGSLSLVVHVMVVVALPWVPLFEGRPVDATRLVAEMKRVTPLIAPPREMTQKPPNQAKVAREFTLDNLLPRPPIHAPAGPPPVLRPGLQPPVPSTRSPAPEGIEAPPVIAQQAPAAALPPGPVFQTPPPQIQQQEKPRLAFESVASQQRGRPASPEPGRLAPPRNTVDEAIRAATRTGHAGGQMVGDGEGSPASAREGLILPPSPSRAASNLELLSDPLGVDFRPYLIQVLTAVRRNWFAVIPESAHLGRRGRVQIQFAISRDGRVPKLVIALPSGAEALDRAAVAGISASNPFSPLPSEFRGDQIRLQLTFSYNMTSP